MNKNILVTGAAGFLGGRVAKHLATHYPEATILGTSRRNFRAKELAQYRCEFQAGDLCDNDFCEKITQNIDIVVHCAALSSPWGTYELFYQANVVANQQLVDASIKNGVKKFIFISTPSIYFAYQDKFNITEKEVPLPSEMINHYAKTKFEAEKYVLSQNGKMETLALRPRAIIGAEDTVIFPRILTAYNEGKLKIVGDGENICDFTCVRNVIEAIICGIEASPKAYGQAFNITNGEPIKLWDAINHTLQTLELKPVTKRVSKNLALFAGGVAESFAKLINPSKEPPMTKYGIGILAFNFTMDITKAKSLLNYQPVQTTFEGINEFLEWQKKQA